MSRFPQREHGLEERSGKHFEQVQHLKTFFSVRDHPTLECTFMDLQKTHMHLLCTVSAKNHFLLEDARKLG